MIKIGIMTINSLNYGNRLQNYALQNWLRSMGFDVRTIKRLYDKNQTGLVSRINSFARYIAGSRAGMFFRFNRKYIKYSKHKAYVDQIEKGLESEFDVIIAGSDQVWNPNFEGLTGLADLLYFPTNSKKIAFAASFGVNAIPDSAKDIYEKALREFNSISVRENAGIEIIRDLIGKQVVLMPDPTLLLYKEQWVEIEHKPSNAPKGKYTLTYFLGNDHVEPGEVAECKKTGGIVYDVLKPDQFGHKPAVGPAEFIWLINHAERVLTNSYHATVFSLIMHVPVKSFPRAGIDMSSRFDTLVQMFSLKDYMNSEGVLEIDAGQQSETINKRILERKKEAEQYIQKAVATTSYCKSE